MCSVCKTAPAVGWLAKPDRLKNIKIIKYIFLTFVFFLVWRSLHVSTYLQILHLIPVNYNLYDNAPLFLLIESWWHHPMVRKPTATDHSQSVLVWRFQSHLKREVYIYGCVGGTGSDQRWRVDPAHRLLSWWLNRHDSKLINCFKQCGFALFRFRTFLIFGLFCNKL